MGVAFCQAILGFAILIPHVVIVSVGVALGARGDGLVAAAVIGTAFGSYVAFWIGRGLARLGGLASTVVVAPILLAVAFAVLLVSSWDWSDILGGFTLIPFIVGFVTFAVAFTFERRQQLSQPAPVEQARQPDSAPQEEGPAKK